MVVMQCVLSNNIEKKLYKHPGKIFHTSRFKKEYNAMDKRSQYKLYITSASGYLGFKEINICFLPYEYVSTILKEILRLCERHV